MLTIDGFVKSQQLYKIHMAMILVLEINQ
jgi:hypothetical protein